MAGWFEAFSDFARGAAPALDRYQMLRQLDQQNQFKLKQQEFDNQQKTLQTQMLQKQMADKSLEHDRQMELMDQAILGTKQKNFETMTMPGSVIDDTQAQKARDIGMGGLVFNQPEIDISSITGEPDVANAGNLPSEFGPEFRQQNENIYAGTPAQQLQLRQQQQQQQQQRLLMGIIGDLDPTGRAQALTGSPVTRPPVQPFRTPIRTDKNTYVDPMTMVEQGLHGYVPPHYESGGAGGNNQATDIDMIERGARAVLEGRASPSQLASLYGGMGGAGAAYKRAITDKVMQLDPAFNLQEAEANYQYSKNPGTQTTARFMENIQKTIPKMRKMVDKMKLSDIRIVNSASLAMNKQFGEGDVAAYEFMTTILADEIAKILQGGGTGNATSDAKLRQAMDLMSGSMTPDQWSGVLDTADEMLTIRRKALTKGTYLDPDNKGGNKTTTSKSDSEFEWKIVDGIAKKVPKVKKQ